MICHNGKEAIRVDILALLSALALAPLELRLSHRAGLLPKGLERLQQLLDTHLGRGEALGQQHLGALRQRGGLGLRQGLLDGLRITHGLENDLETRPKQGAKQCFSRWYAFSRRSKPAS